MKNKKGQVPLETARPKGPSGAQAPLEAGRPTTTASQKRGPLTGQVMLLTIMVLSGTILGATTIAGFLTLYQIRQSTDIINSAKAIFAADAGLECEFYRYTKDASLNCNTLSPLGNGATFTTNGTTPPASPIRSSGEAGDAIRAFEAEF